MRRSVRYVPGNTAKTNTYESGPIVRCTWKTRRHPRERRMGTIVNSHRLADWILTLPLAVSAAAAALGIGAATMSSAATIAVPADQPTIQAAIDFASPFDTISVSPGVYNETLVIEKSITANAATGNAFQLVDFVDRVRACRLTVVTDEIVAVRSKQM